MLVPSVAADGAVLANQHLQNQGVDLVVRAVDGQHLHFGADLTVAVHAALALIQAGGVPRQVVVDHGAEVVLQVDALGQAVGGHQHAALGLGQFRDHGLRPLVGGQAARDGLAPPRLSGWRSDARPPPRPWR